jgi:hypothetical protein
MYMKCFLIIRDAYWSLVVISCSGMQESGEMRTREEEGSVALWGSGRRLSIPEMGCGLWGVGLEETSWQFQWPM